MVEKRYGALRFIAGLFRIAGIVILVLGLLGGFSGAVAALMLGSNLLTSVCWYPLCLQLGEPLGSALILLGGFFLALALFLGFFGAGELLALLLSIEENSRRTAFVLRLALPSPASVAVAPPQTQPEANGGAGH